MQQKEKKQSFSNIVKDSLNKQKRNEETPQDHQELREIVHQPKYQQQFMELRIM